MTTPRNLIVLLLLCVLLVPGCGVLGGFNEAPPTSAQEQTALQSKADEAWNGKKYDRALNLYTLILQGQALTREAKLVALERSAKATLWKGDASGALTLLESWAQLDPKAKSTWNWSGLYVQALSTTGRDRQAEEYLAKLIQARGTTFDLAAPAGIELAKRYASRDQASQAARMLRSLHAKAPDRKGRAQFEADTARMLGSLDAKGLTALLATVNTANTSTFPYNLIAFEDLRRATASNPASRERMRALADELARSSDLADRELPGRILTQGLEAATTAIPAAPVLAGPEVPEVKPGTIAVALLLPQTGQLRALAAKVLAGANAARAQLAAQNIQMDIRVINTDDSNFIDQLTALPSGVSIVGGPMHSTYFKNLPASGELSRRVFLTFLPEVPEAEEGKQVWRFFWSPQDEVNAVLSTPLEEGVKRFAVLAPEDRMGKRLSDTFAGTVTGRGGDMAGLQTYSLQDAAKWGDIVKNMVRAVPAGNDGKTFTSKPEFEAVFIPDELQRADNLISQLHYYQADSLVILGPLLWSTALNSANKPNLSPINYRYAFCPGAWWPQSPSKPMADLKAQLAAANQGDPDFWSALGYDFIRMAAGAGTMPPDTAPAEITHRLNESAKKMEWAMAPISWDPSGHARMSLYFFRMSVEGLVPVDKNGFKERLDALKGKQQATQPQ